MTLTNWIDQEKLATPSLAPFLTKITPYITPTGFNGAEFERKVTLGINSIDKQIDDSLKLDTDAKD